MSEAKRKAYGFVVHAIDDWSVRYLEGDGKSTPVDVRLELEKIKDAFANAATVPPGPPDASGDGMTADTRKRVALIAELDACHWDIAAFAKSRGWSSERAAERRNCQGAGKPAYVGRCNWCDFASESSIVPEHRPYFKEENS